MTPIAKLIEMRQATRGGHVLDFKREQWNAYERALCDACHPAADGGGGLLERHAMLERVLRSLITAIPEPGGRLRFENVHDWSVVRAAMRDASEALPPGKGETP